jgi:hypothetical protein
MNQTLISSRSLGTLVLCAIRYAMGRQTYMPSYVQEIARAHWAELDPNDQKTIRRDVAEAIAETERIPGSLGASFDERGWREFLAWIDLHGLPRCIYQTASGDLDDRCKSPGTRRRVVEASLAAPKDVDAVLCDEHFKLVAEGTPLGFSVGSIVRGSGSL